MEIVLAPPSFKENGVSNPVRICHDAVEVMRFIEISRGTDDPDVDVSPKPFLPATGFKVLHFASLST